MDWSRKLSINKVPNEKYKNNEKMNDWNFTTPNFTLDNSFESDSCDNWFEAKSEDAINPMRAMSAEQITEGLKHAIQDWKKTMKKFGFISSSAKKRSHDWKPTVAKGPKLSTEKRFGKTRREIDGEKLKEERYRRNVLKNVTKPRFLRF